MISQEKEFPIHQNNLPSEHLQEHWTEEILSHSYFLSGHVFLHTSYFMSQGQGELHTTPRPGKEHKQTIKQF